MCITDQMEEKLIPNRIYSYIPPKKPSVRKSNKYILSSTTYVSLEVQEPKQLELLRIFYHLLTLSVGVAILFGVTTVVVIG